MLGNELLRRLDAEMERQHRAEARDLHRAEARERADALAEVRGIRGFGPDPLRLAVVLVGDDRAQLLHSSRHRAREPVDRRTLAEGVLELRRIHRGDGPASSVPIRSLARSGPENACWTVTCWSIANPMRSASGSDAMSRLPRPSP